MFFFSLEKSNPSWYTTYIHPLCFNSINAIYTNTSWFYCEGFHRKCVVVVAAVLTVVTQTGDSLSRGWMPRAGERCAD